MRSPPTENQRSNCSRGSISDRVARVLRRNRWAPRLELTAERPLTLMDSPPPMWRDRVIATSPAAISACIQTVESSPEGGSARAEILTWLDIS